MRQQVLMQTLFLKIADFDIRLSFHTTSETFNSEKYFIDTLTKKLKNFISTEIPLSAHATIKFCSKPSYSILYDTKNSSFIEFFQVKNKIYYTSFYHISLYQFYSLLAHVMNMLLSKHGGIMVHASATLIQGKAFLFLGHSGGGKSTIISLLKNEFTTLADDYVIIRKIKKEYIAYQTPYPEREEWFSKSQSPLQIGKVYFIKKGLKISEKVITNESKVNYLMENTPLPENEKDSYVKFIMDFIAKESYFFEFTFPKNKTVVKNFLQHAYE